MNSPTASRPSATPLPPVATRWQTSRVAQQYDHARFASTIGGLFNRLSLRALRKAIHTCCPMPEHILDVPCGTGRATAVALEHAAAVVGADVSAAMIAEAQRRLPPTPQLRFEEADIAALPFADDSFDCVTCIRLMMHLDQAERVAALRELGRVARYGVVVEYGCMTGWLQLRRQLKTCVHRLRGRTPRYVRAVAWSEIASDLDAAGMTLRARVYTARGLSESVMLVAERR
jgi:ubiquinone/menaquinone biosynthesis C-methylase UbiE